MITTAFILIEHNSETGRVLIEVKGEGGAVSEARHIINLMMDHSTHLVFEVKELQDN